MKRQEESKLIRKIIKDAKHYRNDVKRKMKCRKLPILLCYAIANLKYRTYIISEIQNLNWRVLEHRIKLK